MKKIMMRLLMSINENTNLSPYIFFYKKLKICSKKKKQREMDEYPKILATI